ncbi:beta-hexosaminidase [Betaproteobacteria bacterium]|nr:beta-hexosaminidase [Betaproteobacteria bacterium]
MTHLTLPQFSAHSGMALRQTLRQFIPSRRFRLAAWQKALITWITLGVLAFIATRYFKHPLFYFWRDLETPVLLLASIGGAWFALRAQGNARGWRNRLEPGARLAGWLLLLCLVAGQEGWFRWQQYQVLQANVAMTRMGRHFVVGFRDFDDLKPLAERGLIGGIYITRRNLKGESAQSLRQRVDELQDIRRRADLPPLFVMADQEGGEVSHLSPLVERMPALAELLADGEENLELRALAQGEQQGRELAALGINMNLSPVVDLKLDGIKDWSDSRSLIERRAIAADPWTVARVASAYGAGLVASGVQPTVKHFPGLGRVRGDTHLVKASLPPDPEARAADWLPFREVIKHTGAAMMLAHVGMPDIDPGAPASLSRKLVQDVLRKKDDDGWDYQGILITDDLNMGAVYANGVGRAAVTALDAGVDLVLVSYDPDQYYRALHAAADAWRRGNINSLREVDSAQRLDRYWAKNRLTITTGPVRCDSHPKLI